MSKPNLNPRIAELRARNVLAVDVACTEATSIVNVNDDGLPDLAFKINAAMEAIETGVKSVVANAVEAGDLLNQAKARVVHGGWENWLTTNCVVAPRTAQAYMRLAKSIPLLPHQEAQRVADLPLREAIRAISTSPDKPPKYPSIRIKRDDVERTVAALRKSASAMREAARLLGILHRLKGEQVKALRGKLTAAIEVLDRLTQAGQVDGGAA